MIRGLDVSSHQDPAKIDWDALAQTHRFMIARAAYGTRRDRAFAEHARRAQAAGLNVGGYLFFRAGQNEADQAKVFLEALDAAGCGPGWIIPAIDIERNERYDGPFTRDRYSEQAQLVCEMLSERWGDALVYTNPMDWKALGSPSWLQSYQLWVAHWNVAAPATPFGMQWSIWQTGVSPIVAVYPGPLDQDAALALPLVRSKDPGLLLAELDVNVDWDEQRRARDDYLARQEQEEE